MRTPTVGQYMTPSPHSIAVDRTLADAHKIMRQFKIRHLPVLEGGRLVGVVSERDLHLVETLKDVNPSKVEVEDAMSPDPFVVTPDTPLQDVLVTMWRKKYGSAVVQEGREIVGVFTTIDALRVLITLLARQEPKRRAPARRAAKKTVQTARAAKSSRVRSR